MGDRQERTILSGSGICGRIEIAIIGTLEGNKNTVQTQNNGHLEYYVVIGEKEMREHVRVTVSGTPAAVAARRQMIPLKWKTH